MRPLRYGLVWAAVAGVACGAQVEEEVEDPVDAEAPATPPPPSRDGAAPAQGADGRLAADVPTVGDTAAPSDAAPAAGTDGPVSGLPVRPWPYPAQTRVPVVMIDVAGKAIQKDVDTPGQIRIIEDHDGTLQNLMGRPTTLSSPMVIEIHGNSSSGFPKKSYNVELHDAQGMDSAQQVLGMPPESDWVLYACYTDKTCLRNALAYSIGWDLGRYSPRARFVELFLDGKHLGLYLLVEKVKRDKYRVDIGEPAPDAASGDLTGGYLINRQGSIRRTGHFWITKLGTLFHYRSPNYRAITAAQKAYIQGHIDKFEAVFNTPEWADAAKGYPAWIDLPSFVDFVLVQELTKNVDGYRRSSFLAKVSDARGGRLYAGPLWDFDIAWGNADYMEGWKTDGWIYKVNPLIVALNVAKEEQIQFWWEKIWTDPVFQRAVRCRWQDLRPTALSMAALNAKIDAWVKLLAQAQPRDQALWLVMGRKVWPNYFVGKTYTEEVTWLRNWIDQRARWMDANLPGTCMK